MKYRNLSREEKDKKNKWQRNWRKRTKNASCLKYIKTYKGVVVMRYNAMRGRVNNENEPLYYGLDLLSKKDFYEWALVDNHEYFKIYNAWVESKYDDDMSPSVDRIDPKKGYILGNIRWLPNYQNSLYGLENGRKKNMVNKEGMKIGRLLVIKRLEKDIWECKCDCGNMVNYRSSDFFKVKSCGCIKHEAKKRKAERLSKIGRKFTRIYCENNSTFYESISDAARKLNLAQSNISNVIAGRQKSAKGYVFISIETTPINRGKRPKDE